MEVHNTINSFVSVNQNERKANFMPLLLIAVVALALPIAAGIALAFMVNWDMVGFYLGAAALAAVVLLVVAMTWRFVLAVFKYIAVLAVVCGFVGGLGYALYLAWPTIAAWAPYVLGGIGVVVAFASCCVVAMYVHERAMVRKADFEVAHQLRLAEVKRGTLMIEAQAQPVTHELFSIPSSVEIER